MKIGIVTYHRSHNFGALLQAIALRDVLADMGHQVYFVDYWPDYHKKMYVPIDWDLLKLKNGIHSISDFLYCLRVYNGRKRRADVFKSFIANHIETHVSPYSNDVDYDVVVYGSDQIWRKQYGLGNEFNPVYFGENIIPAKRNISYAASMGVIHSKDNDKRFLKEKLSNFTDISVREDSLKDLLHVCGVDASVVLDPVFLKNAEEWDAKFKLKSPVSSDYLLFYELQQNIIDYSVIRKYASDRNLKIKVIIGNPRTSYESGMEYIKYADPIMFLRLIYNAKVVLTSSYHGLAFSLLFNKDFYAVFKENAGRATSLLKTLNLTDRLLEYNASEIPSSGPICYDKINNVLGELRKESIIFLSNALNSSE